MPLKPTAHKLLLAQQHTMLWTEDEELRWAPGMNKQPLSLLYDEQAEELTFPTIYVGEPQRFKIGSTVHHGQEQDKTKRSQRSDPGACVVYSYASDASLRK